MRDRLPNANDRVRVIATGELATIDSAGRPVQLPDGEWQFFVRLDSNAERLEWRGWFRAGELEIVGDGPVSDPDEYVEEPGELDSGCRGGP